ncbi:RHS repeat-associated core domain-containing protein [Pseudoxanthomonas sacheonensis]|uniref:RHS repeat-associated protein n=1 Tax=Pseudoxanthomonas sacheonensis TaxID=443615 RepID=A0ABU1RNT8_9GAMM|nr:RHS repeat-associated core domain-containing protein [Pseudoxanthomonas sacheonensis]MDR6840428.1 RHS repeat-associated protein [Pseudoxanthomonas sacheonensis]
MAVGSVSAQAQTVEYLHTDALGTLVAVTNTAGVVIERSEYEPYGKLLNRPLADGPGFTGHVQDAATGLTYMQQRYYDPGIGRFLSVDSIIADPKTGANFNRYKYAANNPYRFTDPDGRKEYDCRKGGSCPSEIKIADLKPGDVVHTPGATVSVTKDNNIQVGFKEGRTDGASAARSGPILVPKGPANANVSSNMREASSMSDTAFYKAVKNKGRWDYKQDKSGNYQDFGNFNYGATGKSAGFSQSTLLQAAGIANERAREDNPAIFGSPGIPGLIGTRSNGDDPVDQYWIQQGIRYSDAQN